MVYEDFILPTVVRQFHLTLETTTDLYSAVLEASPDPAFLTRLEEDVRLALAISTEKARSEFIIAPLLAEVRRMTGRRIGLLSGVEFNVVPLRGSRESATIS